MRVETQGVDVSQHLHSTRCPDALLYVWEWFQELRWSRQSNGFGPGMLAYTEIDAWARLTGRYPLEPFETKLLKELDVIWMGAQVQSASDAQELRT